MVSFILIVIGWVIVLVGALGSGINLHVGNLDPLMTGVILILAGLTLRGGRSALWPFG